MRVNNHKGRRNAKKVGSREAAELTASAIEEKLGTEAFHLRSKTETITLRQITEKWMSGTSRRTSNRLPPSRTGKTW